MSEFTKYFDNCKAVFQGGGCKAIAYIGAYEYAYSRGVFFTELAGTSAGAIIAAFIAAGATPDQLIDLVKKTNFTDFVTKSIDLYIVWYYTMFSTKLNMGDMMMDMFTCYFDMDTGCVEVWLTDGRILSIDCTKVEQVEADNMYQRAELDYLIYNDPKAYAELILNGDPKAYLKAVTEYKPLD